MNATLESDDLDVRLRAAFAHRARTTDVGDVAPRSMMRVIDTAPANDTAPAIDVATLDSRRRRWVIPASVAASALLIVGLVGLARVREATPIEPAATPVETTPPPAPSAASPAQVVADLVIVDPLALDLDDWRTSEPAAGSFTVIDPDSLPDGYVVTEEDGGMLLAGTREGYRYLARLTAPADSATLVVSRFVDEPCASSAVSPGVSSSGTTKTAAGDDLVCWTLDDGLSVSLQRDDDILRANVPIALIDLAEQIAFTTVADIPVPNRSDGEPRVGDDTFAGTLDGVPWSAFVDPGALRTMNTFVDARSSGGFENDRLSQPRDLPVGGPGEVSLDGVAGSGALVYGFTSPDVVNLLVERDDGATAVLPVFERELESYFAVPIPDGLVVSRITYLLADGSAYRVIEMPELPAGLTGGYGGYLTPGQPEAIETEAGDDADDLRLDATARRDAEVERIEAEVAANEARARDELGDLIGGPLDEFTDRAIELDLTVRVVQRPGQGLGATADLRSNRVNVAVDGDDVVTAIVDVG